MYSVLTIEQELKNQQRYCHANYQTPRWFEHPVQKGKKVFGLETFGTVYIWQVKFHPETAQQDYTKSTFEVVCTELQQNVNALLGWRIVQTLTWTFPYSHENNRIYSSYRYQERLKNGDSAFALTILE